MPSASSSRATSVLSDPGMVMFVSRRSLNWMAGAAPYLNLRTEALSS